MICQFKKVYLLVFVTFLWSSCSDQNEYEIVDSEEVLPQSKGVYKYANDSLIQDEVDLNQTEELLLQVFTDVNFTEENILRDRKMLFIPNRLGFKNKEETYFIKDSIPYHFIAWEFEDSLKTVNAFYNWLDCFGHDCRSLRIDDEVNATKESFIIWVSNNQITCINSTKNINHRTWQQTLFSNKKSTWNYIIYQPPHGKMTWIVSTTEKKEN